MVHPNGGSTVLLDMIRDLPFKGDRTYLHGTDIYPAIIDALRSVRAPDDARIQVAFRGFARKACRMTLFEGRPVPLRPDGTVTEFSAIWPDGHTVFGRLVEEDTTVNARVPFDEDVIASKAKIVGDVITIKDPPNNTPIELVVAMTKQLHYALFPNVTGHWVFSRLDIVRPLRDEDCTGLRVGLQHRLSDSLTRSEIATGGDRIGDIYFSVGGP